MNNMMEILKWDERGHDRSALGREVCAQAPKPAFLFSYRFHGVCSCVSDVLHAMPVIDAGREAVV